MTRKPKPLQNESHLTRLERLANSMIDTAEATSDPESKGTAARAAIMVFAELRKAEAAERKAEGEITPAQMLERIRRMSATERAQFIRSAQGVDADAGRSGLA